MPRPKATDGNAGGVQMGTARKHVRINTYVRMGNKGTGEAHMFRRHLTLFFLTCRPFYGDKDIQGNVSILTRWTAGVGRSRGKGAPSGPTLSSRFSWGIV